VIYTFYIEDLYTRTEIVEPRDWKDLQSVFKRDFKTHGIFFDYTDGTLKLGFSCEARDLLEEAYQYDGVDAYYKFEVEEAENEHETPTIIYSSFVDFSTRGLDDEYFNVEVNSSNNELKLKNRKNLNINLNSQEMIDGGVLGKMHYDDSIRSLASKPYATLNASTPPEVLDSVQSTNGTTIFATIFGQFGLVNESSTEIEKFKTTKSYYDPDIDGNTTGAPSMDKTIVFERDVALVINYSYNFSTALTLDGGSSTSWSIWHNLAFSNNIITETGASLNVKTLVQDSTTATNPTFNESGSGTVYIKATKGTEMRFIHYITCSGTSGPMQFTADTTINSFEFEITDINAYVGTIGQWYNIHDALNKNLNFITGNYDLLYSELLGNTINGYSSNGCLGNTFITNGYRVRQINDDKKAPSLSFNDFIDNLNALQAIGYGFEDLESPKVIGKYDIQWRELVAGIAELRILPSQDISSEFSVGSNLGMYNNETLHGVYEITDVTWTGSYTNIKIDVSENTNYHDNVYGEYPLILGVYTDVVLTCDKTTESRERIRVERWEHFYGDNELIDLGIVEEYSEEPFSEALVNEIKFEFHKYANDEKKSTTLEDFHTKAGWAVPLEKTDDKIDLRLNWIGSTFLLNESRDTLNSEKPTTSHKLDDDLFFCDKESRTGTYTVDFVNPGDYISMPGALYDNIIFGSNKFTVSGSSSNDGNYHIDLGQEVVYDMSNEAYFVYVVEALTNDSSDSATFTPIYDGQTEYKPEATENLTSQSGVTADEYMYNQRRSMKRMLLRWGNYLMSCLAYVADSKVLTLRNLIYVSNGDYTSTIDTSGLDSSCYENTSATVEDENVNTDILGTSKFKPNIIRSTIKICDDDYTLIRNAHRNSDIYDRNYGYFTVINNQGETKTGWLLDMKRSPLTRIASVKIIERYV